MDTCPPGKICLNQQLFVIIALCFAIFIGWLLFQNTGKNENWLASPSTILKKKDITKDMDNYYYLDTQDNNRHYLDRTPIINSTLDREHRTRSSQDINKSRMTHMEPSQPAQATYPYTPHHPSITNPYQPSIPTNLHPPTTPSLIPTSQHQVPSLPINMPTRGYQTIYQQVGILHNKNKKKGNIILPLYGKAVYPGSSKWHYYATSDGFNTMKLDVKFYNKMGMSEHGCEEISEGDIVGVPAYRQPFIANIYHLDKPTYIPYVH